MPAKQAWAVGGQVGCSAAAGCHEVSPCCLQSSLRFGQVQCTCRCQGAATPQAQPQTPLPTCPCPSLAQTFCKSGSVLLADFLLLPVLLLALLQLALLLQLSSHAEAAHQMQPDKRACPGVQKSWRSMPLSCHRLSRSVRRETACAEGPSGAQAAPRRPAESP